MDPLKKNETKKEWKLFHSFLKHYYAKPVSRSLSIS